MDERQWGRRRGLDQVERLLVGLHEKVDQVLRQQRVQEAQERQIMAALDDLTTQVSANTDTEASALVLINGIAARIAAAGTDPAKLSALTSSLKTSGDALAAAVVQNTPAA